MVNNNYLNESLVEAQSASHLMDTINSVQQEEKNSSAKVELFFSFDMVDSTAYKAKNENWASALTKQVSYIIDAVTEKILGATLWRIIGDELVFACEINNKDEVFQIVESIYDILLVNQSRANEDNKERCKEENSKTFDTTAAAWIAPVIRYGNIVPECIDKYNNIRMDYKFEDRTIHEFLGTDIDTGFRIKKETERRRLVISYELALLLNERTEYSSRLNIITYKTLKGVWDEKPYPIIWYYDAKKHDGIPFDKSFAYYESIASGYAQEYFKNMEQHSGCIPLHLIQPANEALGKVCSDLEKREKIEYIREVLERPGGKSSGNNDFRESSLELHFAAVCCDVDNKKIMILRRAGREVLDAKWEFGCAKANAEDHIEDIIEKTYKDRFGLTIEVMRDTSRTEVRAKPIALYEYPESGNNHKGVIVVAKIKSGLGFVEEFIKKSGRYDDVKWLSEADAEEFKYDAVPDLKNSMKKVFDNWESFFCKEDR